MQNYKNYITYGLTGSFFYELLTGLLQFTGWAKTVSEFERLKPKV